MMNFAKALELLKMGIKVKRTHWSGYWIMEDNMIYMHCKDGEVIKMTDTKDLTYTLSSVVAEDWETVEGDDIYIVETFAFGEAIRRLKQGERVARKGWNGKNMWLGLVEKENYVIVMPVGREEDTEEGELEGLLPWIGMKTADNKFVPWLASQSDMLSDDWVLVE